MTVPCAVEDAPGWNTNSTYVCIDVTRLPEAEGIIIGVLVIAVTSLLVIMGNVLATSYLARIIRQNKEEHCDCSKRKYTLTQYDKESTQLPLPGLTNQTEHNFDPRKRCSSSPEVSPSKKSLKDDEAREADNENEKDGVASPTKPRRSRSLTHGKKWPGIHLRRKNYTLTEKQSEKKKKKEKVLKSNPTPTGLLQNMREINYELNEIKSKSDVQQRESQTKSNVYEESQGCPLEGSTSGRENVSSAPDDQINSKNSGMKGSPHYYTLEPININDDDDSEDINSVDTDEGEKAKLQPKSLSAQVSLIDDRNNGIPVHMLARSMSDAYQKRRKKPSFRIVPTMPTNQRNGSDSNVSGSVTWNARMLTKSAQSLRRGKYSSYSSEAYEDVGNSADTGVLRPRGVRGSMPVTAAEADGSYSLLSRSLEDGLDGLGRKTELSGYQKLTVGADVMV